MAADVSAPLVKPPAGRWGLTPALLALLLVMGLYRGSLTDRGALAVPDESRYEGSVTAVRRLMAGDLRSFCYQISSTHARPGDAVLRLVPAGIQVALESTGLPYWDNRSLRVALLHNVLASLLLLYVFYRLALHLFGGDQAAWVAAAFYALLANSNFYIRHILPYDWSLLVGMTGLLYVAGRAAAPKPRDFAIAGLLAGACFAIYPGYYAFAPASLAVLLLSGGWRAAFSAAAVRGGVLCGAGFLAVIGGFEVLARLGRTSYLGEMRQLSGTITQGSFEEGFVFPFQYLLAIEGVAGGALLLGLGAGLWFGFRKQDTPPSWAHLRPALAVMAVMLLHNCLASAVFRSMVWYGRLLHLYLPFGVLLAVYGVSRWKSPRWKHAAYFAALAAGAVAFGQFALGFQRIAYPRDVHLAHGITRPDLQAAAWESPVPQERAFGKGGEDARLILVNPSHFWPVPNVFTPFTPPAGSRVVYRGDHFLRFPAYGFEGYSIEERRRLHAWPYQVGIYTRPVTAE